jgi:hypothetical protein
MGKCCRGTIIILRTEVLSFLKGKEEKHALVLSNEHKRTSTPDGPSFGSIGLPMNTSSLM